MMFMLCNQCTLGGAEKRYARVFQRLADRTDIKPYLVINRTMLNLLQSAGILTDHDPFLIVLEPLSQRVPFGTKQATVRLAIDALGYMRHCWRLMRQYRPAVVHPLLTAVFFCLPALWADRRTRLVVSAYSYQFENYRDRRLFGVPIGATLKRWQMQRSQAIDALSGSIRDDLVARGLAVGKITVAPCSFTDLTRCQPATVREKAVVFLGRFVAIKNPLLLAQAIPIILKNHPDTRFYFLGDGELETAIKELVHRYECASQVVINFVPQPTTILNRTAIFVSLQTEENYPSQSLLEAMACGNAIVATDAGETWRLVDEQNGLRVQATAQAVAAAIMQLLDDPCLAQKQAASRQRVLTEHTAERFFEYIFGLYMDS